MRTPSSPNADNAALSAPSLAKLGRGYETQPKGDGSKTKMSSPERALAWQLESGAEHVD